MIAARRDGIAEHATANDVVQAHVKPYTQSIRGQGSGPFVELIQGSADCDSEGVRWTGKPTHMVSYSWSYTLHTMLDILRKFETEHPPAAAETHRYYIDVSL